MSGFIEKITLYDLLGYAVPGSIFLGMWGVIYVMIKGNPDDLYRTYKDSIGFLLTVLLVLGYVVGMLISEFTDILLKVAEGSLSFDLKQDLRNKKLNERQVEKALKKAGYMKQEDQIQSMDDVELYFSSMYGDIQSDAKYSRLHNYASSKLIYKNMSFVSFCGVFTVLFLYNAKHSGMMFLLDRDMQQFLIAVGIFCVSGCLFFRRWKRMNEKTHFYTAVWFIEKYSGKDKNVAGGS